MAKRRMSKTSKRRLTCFGTISVIAIVYFVFSLLYNIYVINNLNNEKKKNQEYYVSLQEEFEQLKKYKDKLENSDEYKANYAREHYFYAKDGEYKLKIEEAEENIDNISNEINKNYIILGLSGLVILIFIYILSKGSRNKTSKK